MAFPSTNDEKLSILQSYFWQIAWSHNDISNYSLEQK